MNYTNQRYFLGAAAVILATLVGTLVAYPDLPGTVPVHWNAHGQIDGWAPKWTLYSIRSRSHDIYGGALCGTSLAVAEEV